MNRTVYKKYCEVFFDYPNRQECKVSYLSEKKGLASLNLYFIVEIPVLLPTVINRHFN
jgi:hypothetical protein